jgi:hypothetical protein
VPESKVRWIQHAIEAQTSLQQALREAQDDPQNASLKKTIILLGRTMSHLSLVNEHLQTAASGIGGIVGSQHLLDDLVQAMSTIDEEVRKLKGFEAEKVAQFNIGAHRLPELNKSFSQLLDDHDQWQFIDHDLRELEHKEGAIEALTIIWPSVKRQIMPLLAPNGADLEEELLRIYGEKIDKALLEKQSGEAQYWVRSYRRQVVEQFQQVDGSLLESCNDLCNLCDPLDKILEVLT